MDGYAIASGIGVAVVVLAILLFIIPLWGEVMYIIIENVLGHDMNKELYWTGVGLLAVFGTIIYAKSKDD